jgi:hypothetical protein
LVVRRGYVALQVLPEDFECAAASARFVAVEYTSNTVVAQRITVIRMVCWSKTRHNIVIVFIFTVPRLDGLLCAPGHKLALLSIVERLSDSAYTFSCRKRWEQGSKN